MINIAHIHPMLVHFPIVLFLLAVAIDFLVLLKGGAKFFAIQQIANDKPAFRHRIAMAFAQIIVSPNFMARPVKRPSGVRTNIASSASK